MKKKITLISKKAITLKNGKTFQEGTYFSIIPLDKSFVEVEALNIGEKFRMSYIKLHKFFDVFITPPTIDELICNSIDGVTTTPLGNNVEIDGEDEYGYPSWFTIYQLAI